MVELRLFASRFLNDGFGPHLGIGSDLTGFLLRRSENLLGLLLGSLHSFFLDRVNQFLQLGIHPDLV